MSTSVLDKMEVASIFDIRNIGDLPESVKKGISKVNTLKQNILHCFTLKDDLTRDEILVGVYRLFKIEINHHSLAAMLSSLKVQGVLLKDGDFYQLKSKVEEPKKSKK